MIHSPGAVQSQRRGVGAVAGRFWRCSSVLTVSWQRFPEWALTLAQCGLSVEERFSNFLLHAGITAPEVTVATVRLALKHPVKMIQMSCYTFIWIRLLSLKRGILRSTLDFILRQMQLCLKLLSPVTALLCSSLCTLHINTYSVWE